MSSSDGFCSTLSFSPGELGQPYVAPVSAPHHATVSTAPSTCHTPIPLISQSVSPSFIRGNPMSASPSVTCRPASPARSSSASSINTISAHQSAASVINNPTPTLGSVPLVTAANSTQPPTLPLTTPPQTPMSGVSHSATSSISSSFLGKRDISAASESEKEDAMEQNRDLLQQPPKKRRIAPTLVLGGKNGVTSTNNNEDTVG